MKKYKKESGHLYVKFVDVATNRIVLSFPSNTMEIHNFFNNDYVDGVLKNSFGTLYEKYPLVRVVIDTDFKLS